MPLPSKSLPDFSVIIPTYNRSSFAKRAALSALNQKKVSLEVLVVDDCSSDDTKSVIAKIKDRRLRYIRNPNRLGTGANFLKCFKHARGKYVFTLGDDDFILNENTLFVVKATMQKYNSGIGRVGGVAYESSPQAPYGTQILSDKLLYYKPEKGLNILVKSIEFGLGYFSGVVFENKRLDKKMLELNHQCYPHHMCNAYLRLAYDLIIKHGMVYIPKYLIVGHLSLALIPKYFSIKPHGRFFLEETIKLVSEFANERELSEFTHVYLRTHLVLLPNIKYFTNLSNYFAVLSRLVVLDNTLIYSPKFIVYSAAGLLPNFIIKFIRDTLTLKGRNTVPAILKKYNYYKDLKKLDFLQHLT